MLEFQTPETWLQWRMKVGEGFTEVDAWELVVRENILKENAAQNAESKVGDVGGDLESYDGAYDYQYQQGPGELFILASGFGVGSLKREPRGVF